MHDTETNSTRERNLFSPYWYIRPFIDSMSLVVVGKKNSGGQVAFCYLSDLHPAVQARVSFQD